MGVHAFAVADDPVNCTLANQGASNPKVEDGSAIRSLEVQLTLYLNTAPALPRHFIILIRKNEKALLPALAAANSFVIGTLSWKDRIFHMEQAQPGTFAIGGIPMVFHIRVRVPKRFHRMEKTDQWELIVASPDAVAGDTYDMCSLVTYKWYR